MSAGNKLTMPNQPLDKGILPRTPWCDQAFFDPHVPHALPTGRSIHAIPIATQVSWDVVPRKCRQHLPGRPLGCGMLGDIEADIPHLPHDFYEYLTS
jgi:hypothetical protein